MPETSVSRSQLCLLALELIDGSALISLRSYSYHRTPWSDQEPGDASGSAVMKEEFDANAEKVSAFKTWLINQGGYLSPHVDFVAVPSGFNVIAKEAVSADESVVSCPFSLAITPALSKRALTTILRLPVDTDFLQKWNERQLVCTYICMHFMLDGSNAPAELEHRPYIDMLPEPSRLRTSLHFTPSELERFRGTNLYGATIDRRKEWEGEWTACRADIAISNSYLAGQYTWPRYLTAATYLSSRAFSSTLLSNRPSLVSTPDSYPVLLPGIDSLNHARGQPVSWVVSYPLLASDFPKVVPAEPTISLVIHTSTPAGAELFNNYGRKPNSELVLGYGFSLPNNPDDTIVLKLGGSQSQGENPKWEVGRDAQGAEPVWEAVKDAVRGQTSDGSGDQSAQPEETTAEDAYEEELWATEVLREMAEDLLSRLPRAVVDSEESGIVRPDVSVMLEHYVEGQRDILLSLMDFAKGKEQSIIERIRDQGIEIAEVSDAF